MSFSYNTETKTATISLKVKAGARFNSISTFVDANESHLVKININAAPENGKANAAIIKMLAAVWGLKQNQLEIIKGHSGSLKTLVIKDVERKEVEDILHSLLPNKQPH